MKSAPSGYKNRPPSHEAAILPSPSGRGAGGEGDLLPSPILGSETETILPSPSSSFVKCIFLNGFRGVCPHVERLLFRLYRKSIVRIPACGDQLSRSSLYDRMGWNCAVEHLDNSNLLPKTSCREASVELAL